MLSPSSDQEDYVKIDLDLEASSNREQTHHN
jgi:hypothetical protein